MYFVGDKQDILRLAKIICLLQITFVGHKNTRFSLDGFNQETCYIRIFQRIFKGGEIVVRDGNETGRKRSEILAGIGIIRHGYHRDGTAMKVILATDDFCLVFRYPLHHIAPFTGKFQGGFIAFGARIHRKHTLVAKIFSNEFLVRSKHIVVESPGGQFEGLSLFNQGPDDPWMAVTLVHGRIGR